MRRSRVLLPLLVLMILATMASPAAALSTGPVYAGDFPDPFILRVGGSYFAFATGDARVHLRVMQSTDLVTWTANGGSLTDPLPEALPTLPVWAAQVMQQTWAPEVLQRGPDTFLMYYATQDRVSGRHCISVATATVPQGPYSDHSTAPFVCHDGGSIDPSPFLDTSTGRLYLLWKGEPTVVGGSSTLWSQQLSTDGRSLQGSRRGLLTATAPWQHNLIEGPSMLRRGGTLYLFYGASAFDQPTAAIGYATCTSPLPPAGCSNATPTGPWLAGDNRVKGPAGPATVMTSGGTLKLAYHAWWPWTAGGPFPGYNTGALRALWIDNLTFQAGTPVPS